MKRDKLTRLTFMALCCTLGLFSKRLISPAANIVTDSLHIPGGISTGFSLMFLVIAASITPGRGCAALMSAVQSALALSLGMVGSMGVLSPLGYIVPGLVIDCVYALFQKSALSRREQMLLANILASAAACLTANLIVFRLRGIVLALYVSVAALSGAVCGVLAGEITGKLKPIFKEG